MTFTHKRRQMAWFHITQSDNYIFQELASRAFSFFLMERKFHACRLYIFLRLNVEA